jgi:hypothetical protein
MTWRRRWRLSWPEERLPIIRSFGSVTAGSPPGTWRYSPNARAAGPFELTLFDGTIGADWSWSARDEAMAARLLAGGAGSARTLVAAGNAHTPVGRTGLGLPMAACLTQRRPGVREIRINYRSGYFYNCRPIRFATTSPEQRQVRLRQHGDALVLDLPSAREAVVPHRPMPQPPSRSAQ